MRCFLTPAVIFMLLIFSVFIGNSLAQNQTTADTTSVPAVTPANANPAVPKLPETVSAPAASVPVNPDAVVENGKTVSFDYWLTVDGKEIENSEKLGPVDYVQGNGEVIPGLEKNLMGMKAGQEKSFKVSVEDGYGQVDPKAVQEVSKTLIPANIELKVGVLLQMNDDKGNVFPATIMEIKEDKVKLDFNHPLAGKDLDFKVKVVSVK